MAEDEFEEWDKEESRVSLNPGEEDIVREVIPMEEISLEVLRMYQPMKLPEFIIKMADDANLTFNHAYIGCTDAEKKKVLSVFKKEYIASIRMEMICLLEENPYYTDLTEIWLNDFDFVSTEDFNCYENDYSGQYSSLIIEKAGRKYYWSFKPNNFRKYFVNKIYEMKTGFLITYKAPVFYTGGGDVFVGSSTAMEKTLEVIYEKMQDISYYGYEGYIWRDIHGCDIVQNEFFSEREARPEPDEYIGNIIMKTWEEKTSWEYSGDNIKNVDTVKIIVECYLRYLPVIGKEKFSLLTDNIEDTILSEAFRRVLSESQENGLISREEIKIIIDEAMESKCPNTAKVLLQFQQDL